jgi:hypothetical protein
MHRSGIAGAAAAVLLAAVTTCVQAGVLLFERTPYGLLFAEITVAGQPLKAMIDFGDPFALQLASSFVEAQGLAPKASGKRFRYADGTEFELLEGIVGDVVIGGVALAEVTYGSAPGEIDGVAAQVGTPFQAAVGWGFFGERRFLLAYAAGKVRLDLEACPDAPDAVVERDDLNPYLIAAGRIDGRAVRWLIDTGSPVNVLDRSVFDDVRAGATPAPIDHVAGRLEGHALPLKIGAWRDTQVFTTEDLGALAPLGAHGILGAPFLESVMLCHEPGEGTLRLTARDG